VSAIGRIGDSYSQNAKTLPAYYEALAQGRFPVERGLALDRDDRLRREVIMALMCQGRADLAAIGAAHGVEAGVYFEAELESLQGFVDEGLARRRGSVVEVTASGWHLVRAIAMLFDRHLARAGEARRFSRVL